MCRVVSVRRACTANGYRFEQVQFVQIWHFVLMITVMWVMKWSFSCSSCFQDWNIHKLHQKKNHVNFTAHLRIPSFSLVRLTRCLPGVEMKVCVLISNGAVPTWRRLNPTFVLGAKAAREQIKAEEGGFLRFTAGAGSIAMTSSSSGPEGNLDVCSEFWA